MGRIWNLRLNLDELNALAAGLFTDAEKAQAFHGLILGCNGGTLPEHCSGAVADAFKVSLGWRVEASNYMQKKVDAGNASAKSRREKNGTAQPIRTVPEQRSSDVQADMEHRPEQAPNQSTIHNQLSNTPPSPSRVKRERKPKVDNLGATVPLEVLNAVGRIIELTPKTDAEGRTIRATRGETLARVEGILAAHKEVTPEMLVLSWENYLKTHPKFIKAPQYFFGKQEDQGDTGANWRPYARAIFVARQAQEVPLAPTA